jgi:hypothetical protein
MPPEDRTHITSRVSGVNPLSGETTEIESFTTSGSTRMEEPRVIRELRDLSLYTDELIGNTNMYSPQTTNPDQWEYDETLSFEQGQVSDIEHRYPGLLQQINNIINSRIAEVRGTTNFNYISPIIYDACIFRLREVLGLNYPSSVLSDPVGRVVLGWVEDAFALIRAGTLKPPYQIGPKMPNNGSNVEPKKVRNIVIFKG